ncbi:MAG: hypothetical protein ABIK73_09340 [candidate division WOR-3 bacterium]
MNNWNSPTVKRPPVQNNPLSRFDLNGLTDFTLNKKTGEVKEVKKTDAKTDRIVKIDKHGNPKVKGEGFLGSLVKESNRGEYKTAIGGIAKGILEDGQNFKTQDNIIEVGGNEQPSVKDVEEFALKLASYINKEIGGTYFSKIQNGDIDNSTHITIGQYQFNDSHETKAFGETLGYNKGLYRNGKFHTHQSTGDRYDPSPRDKTSRDSEIKSNMVENPTLRFFILTFPKNYDDRYPARIDYTKTF